MNEISPIYDVHAGTRIGVLLAQLGTPEAPTQKAVRRYLREFLSDRRVIETNRALWWVILHALILPSRPKRSARLYQRIWRETGSPLFTTTASQAKRLSERLRERDHSIRVEFGMRYGEPSLASAIDHLMEQGCGRILVFPLYPQYSGATTSSTFDAVFRHLMTKRRVPSLRLGEPFYDDPRYVRALVNRINSGLASMPYEPERLILSYHGLPETFVKKGDPYRRMCEATTEAVAARIPVPREHILHVYQSRFGKEPWLSPYADETLVNLARNGVRRVAVACPSFASDCLETLDEIGHEARMLFQKEGGEELHLIPALNDSSEWINSLTEIVLDELVGWTEPPHQLN